MTTKTIVLYHANCMDGFASAWSHNYLVGRQMQNVEYYAMNYNDPEPVDCTYQDVIMLDYSMKLDKILGLCKRANSVTIIDHHVTAINELGNLADSNMKPENLTMILATENSGCRLTWHYYSKKAPPLFIKLIEDRDLWLFKIEATEAFHTKASTMVKDFSVWDDFIHPDNLKEILAAGRSILAYENSLVETITKGKYFSTIDEHKIFFCNCPYELMSKVGNNLLESNAVDVVCLFVVADQHVKYSLRSNDKVDSAELASRFGGGGHKKAAGFTMSIVGTHLIGNAIYSESYIYIK